MLINCAIIDDDQMAIMSLVKCIKRTPFIKLTDIFTDPAVAIEKLNSLKELPDLIFLDIMMPNLTGIEVIKKLKKKPEIIFTTSRPEFAMNAFDLDVMDYLLKPISFARFTKSVLKVQQKLEPESTFNLSQNSLFLKTKTGYVRLNLDDISFIERYDEGVKVVTSHYHNDMIGEITLSEIFKLLPKGRFVKVNRDTIVNMDKISSLNTKNLLIKGVNIGIEPGYETQLMRLLYV